jgi:thymidylate synthase (FAD)
MELIDSSVELVKSNGHTIDDIYYDIARAGRICYASDKTSDNEKFVQDCIKKGHGRPLEFGTVYLQKPAEQDSSIDPRFGKWVKYANNPYSKIRLHDSWLFVTTNYRVLVENEWLDDLQYLTAPTPWHFIRYTLHWTISRAIADEFRTHTALSSLMQSTRYCNYSKDRFGNKLTIVRPNWITLDFGEYDFAYLAEQKSLGIGYINFEYLTEMLQAECRYLLFTQTLNVKPEDARSILPLDIKTEFIQCGFLEDWKHFFDLRAHNTTGKAHPDSIKIATEAEKLIP